MRTSQEEQWHVRYAPLGHSTTHVGADECWPRIPPPHVLSTHDAAPSVQAADRQGQAPTRRQPYLPQQRRITRLGYPFQIVQVHDPDCRNARHASAPTPPQPSPTPQSLLKMSLCWQPATTRAATSADRVTGGGRVTTQAATTAGAPHMADTVARQRPRAPPCCHPTKTDRDHTAASEPARRQRREAGPRVAPRRPPHPATVPRPTDRREAAALPRQRRRSALCRARTAAATRRGGGGVGVPPRARHGRPCGGSGGPAGARRRLTGRASAAAAAAAAEGAAAAPECRAAPPRHVDRLRDCD